MSRQTIFTVLGLAIVACGERSQLSQDEVVLATASANPVAALASAAERALVPAPLLQDTAKTVTRRIWADADLYDLSPDGRLAAQTDWTTGDLAVRDMATGEVRHLTHNSAPYDPGMGERGHFSRDGKWVAYTWYDIQEPASYKLGIVDIAGRNPRLIYRERGTTWIEPADWSPDGRYILAFRTVEGTGAEELLLISSADGNTRVLKSVPDGLEFDGSFSPDGRYVAFSLQDDDEAGSDIFAVNVATGEEHVLVQHPADDKVLGWAPDGRHVLFQSDRSGTPGAWLLPVSDGKPSGTPWLVKPDMWRTGGLRFAEDGTYFYTVNTARTDVYVASFDPASHSVIGAPTTITARSVDDSRHAFWSPDGRHLAYNVNSGDRPDRIVVRSMETGDTKEFGGFDPGLLLGGWSPDGRSLLVLVIQTTPIEKEGDAAAYQLDIQTGSRSLLSVGPDFPLLHPSTAPEAEYRIYEKSEENRQGQTAFRIVRESVETGDTTVLFRTTFGAWGQIHGARLSPDGRTLAFGYEPPEGPPRLVLLPTEGGEPTELMDVEITTGIAWMPDGRALLFQRFVEVGPVWEVLYLDLSEKTPHPIGLTTYGRYPGLDIDAQGRRIAYTSGKDGSELWVMENFLPEDASQR